jgi:hypothetical protein
MRVLPARLWLSFLLCLSSPILAAETAPPAPAAGITYAGGDGLTLETAIRIVGATGEEDGVAAEYRWLQTHAAGGERGEQSLLNKGGRVYDCLEWRWPDGTTRSYYFDITDFFGKY